MTLDWDVVWSNLPRFWDGALMTIWLAVVTEYVNAEQAALISKPHACRAPILC